MHQCNNLENISISLWWLVICLEPLVISLAQRTPGSFFEQKSFTRRRKLLCLLNFPPNKKSKCRETDGQKSIATSTTAKDRSLGFYRNAARPDLIVKGWTGVYYKKKIKRSNSYLGPFDTAPISVYVCVRR